MFFKVKFKNFFFQSIHHKFFLIADPKFNGLQIPVSWEQYN